MAVDMSVSVTFTCQSMAGPNLKFAWLANVTTEVSRTGDIVVRGPELTITNYNINYRLGGRYICICIVTNLAGEGRDGRDLFGKL